MSEIPKDQARDLEADLAICEAATLGPWKLVSGPDRACITAPNGPFDPMSFRENVEFAVAAREGWPYAIRRTMEAEKENDRLRNELNILQEHHQQGDRGCFD